MPPAAQRSELKITVPHKPPADVLAAAANEPGTTGPQTAVDRKRADLHATEHDQMAQQRADDDAALPETLETPVAREDVESITVELPDKSVVVFGPPVGVSLTTRIAALSGSQNLNEAMDMIARVCMCVRSINGKKTQPIGNMVDVQKMSNRLGDDGLDLLAFAMKQHWPGVRLQDLRIVKKNLRG